MKLLKCFTVGLYARSPRRRPLRELLSMLVFNPGYRVVMHYRIAVYLKKVRFPRRLTNLLGSLILTRLCRVPGAEIRTEFEIGEGLSVYHPHDIVIGAGCPVGKNVTIYSGVALGARIPKAIDQNNHDSDRYPTIEDGVTIFSGAKIIGPVRIGKNSIVGANSVVRDSFQENSVIVGIPARLLGKRK